MKFLAISIAVLLSMVWPVTAQTLPTDDPVLHRLWSEGNEHSRAMLMMQVLADSIGPRLTGSPGIKAGNEWLLAMYRSWGIAARNEPYGTWVSWKRGVSHIDLVAPRVRSLEGTMLAWSPGTGGKPAEGSPIILPEVTDSAAFRTWLPQVKNRFVLISQPQPTCRPDSSFKQFALPETFDRLVKDRTAAREAWTARVQHTGLSQRDLPKALEQAGARGVVTSLWSQGWGVTKIFQARTENVPTVELSCEDYGLVYRLTEHNQGPVLRITAESALQGELPVWNTIAEIKGSEKPDEYVMLSAHFDSWDGSSGATDNGTGTITMLEAMRILKTVYPHPRRTILVGHWSGEEQGLNGSRAFAADHPEIVKGLQALFNQDNGTGRIVNVSTAGLTGASANFGRYFSTLPTEFTRNVTLAFPGQPAGGGSDNASFICYGAPGFGLGSLPWEYFSYTWHTNRDTFDKVVGDELQSNATMTAMLVYLASEDPVVMPRERRVMPLDGQGQQTKWPECVTPARATGQSNR